MDIQQAMFNICVINVLMFDQIVKQRHIMSIIIEMQHLKYSYCQVNSHQDQVNNYVCINSTCSKKGLLCAICKSIHHDHHQDVIPLKILMSKLNTAKLKTIQFDQFQQYLEHLDNIKDNILYQLKLNVEKIAETFRTYEENIIADFSQLKEQLLEKVTSFIITQLQIEVNLDYQNIIRQINFNQISEEEYTQKVRRLASAVIPNGQSFQISNDLSFLIERYEKTCLAHSNSLTKLAAFTENILLKSKELTFQQFLSKSGLLLEKNVVDPSLKINPIKQNYVFDYASKSLSIEVLDNGKKARQTVSAAPGRFAIILGGSGEKQRKISLKIVEKKNWVGVGICLKDKITSCSYKFLYSNIGHGSYLASSNGYTWSHSDAADNIHLSNFIFNQGEILDVRLTEKEIIFIKRTDGSELKLSIHLKQEDWANVCFCANLCDSGDSVEICQ